MCALIEARSCERMKILSEGLRDIDPSLAQFYRGLLACEARHHQIYIDILDGIYDKDLVRQRLDEIAKLKQGCFPNQMNSHVFIRKSWL